MTPLEWIKQMLEANREGLRQMPFPEGMAEYVDNLVKSGQTQEIIDMMKLGFLMGLQQGNHTDESPATPPSRIQA